MSNRLPNVDWEKKVYTTKSGIAIDAWTPLSELTL